MTFNKDIADLQKHVDAMHSIGEIRTHLIRRNLRLIVSIYTRGVHCLDWDITNKKICGIVDLALMIRISKIFESNTLAESRIFYPVRLDRADWVDQKNLFEILKQGIKTCIKNVC